MKTSPLAIIGNNAYERVFTTKPFACSKCAFKLTCNQESELIDAEQKESGLICGDEGFYYEELCEADAV